MGRVEGGGVSEVGAKTLRLWGSAPHERDDS